MKYKEFLKYVFSFSLGISLTIFAFEGFKDKMLPETNHALLPETKPVAVVIAKPIAVPTIPVVIEQLPVPVVIAKPIAAPTISVVIEQLPVMEMFPLSENNYTEEERNCLALNVYWESKNQSPAGQVAVGIVTLNRVTSKKFPNTICKVVKQARYWKGNPVRNKCHFSWWCDGKHDKPIEHQAWLQAKSIADSLIDNWMETDDITYGALWYHADYVSPKWKKLYKQTAKIGVHIFYGI